jgi:lipopolysaccharide transport system permease protein
MSLPMAAVLGGLVDFAIAFVVLIGMMFYYKIYPTTNIIWLPLFVLLIIITALGTSLWLSAMNVQFRDVQYMVPFIAQFWMFITPVVYPTTLIENPILRAVYALNPMVGVIDGFRWALLGTDTAPGPIIIISTVTSLVILVSGAFYFRRMEKTFADVV